VVNNCVKKFKTFGQGTTKFRAQIARFKFFFFTKLIKGHNSRIIKGIISKFELDPCILVKIQKI
jgi:hypothetical protein